MAKKKQVTMSDVAQRAGVSRTTASFVLNDVTTANIPEETRQRVLQAAQELNYMRNVAALTLATGKTMLIALIVRQTSEATSVNIFTGEFIRGVLGVIEPEDYHLVIHAAGPNQLESTYGKLARIRRVDGLLITLPLLDDPEMIELYEEHIPVVLHGTLTGGIIPSVDIDNEQAAYQAVRHLVELGHRRIGHISNAPFSYASSSHRFKGYRRALDEAGIPYQNQLVLEGDFISASGYLPMQKLLDLPQPPTAVFVSSDIIALGAIAAIRERGYRIPEDISMIGFNDYFFSQHLNPPLTTIRVPAFELGRHAAQLILDLIAGKEQENTQILLPTELIVRGSAVKRQ
jgi:DNA-binding LacI/PurR family transcriptional regulator